jgi:hypothetical protein
MADNEGKETIVFITNNRNWRCPRSRRTIATGGRSNYFQVVAAVAADQNLHRDHRQHRDGSHLDSTIAMLLGGLPIPFALAAKRRRCSSLSLKRRSPLSQLL